MKQSLQANYLCNRAVMRDNVKLPYLHLYFDKLDGICDKLNLLNLSLFCDITNTSSNSNIDDDLLPDTSEKTGSHINYNEEVSILNSDSWVDARLALNVLECLLRYLNDTDSNSVLFIPKEDSIFVCKELDHAIIFAKKAIAEGARFNFSITTSSKN